MRTFFCVLALGTVSLIVGCGSGSSNVMENADPEAIASYEQAVKDAEESMTESNALSLDEMTASAQESGDSDSSE